MSYSPPRKNAAHVFYVGLRSQADTKLYQSNPTLAAGDFQVSIDGGALANLATLPTVTPASSRMVKIRLSATEMNGDNITIVAADAAGAEWNDEVWNLQPETDTVLLQTLVMGARREHAEKLASLEAVLAGRIETLRVAVLDLQQSLLRGRG